MYKTFAIAVDFIPRYCVVDSSLHFFVFQLSVLYSHKSRHHWWTIAMQCGASCPVCGIRGSRFSTLSNAFWSLAV